MNAINSIFVGLLGYERLMLVCGFVLFLFALVAITVMIVQRRDFKAAVLLLVCSAALMGFPGIAAVKFSNDMIEIERLARQPTASVDPQQREASAQTLARVERRTAGNPALLAQVAGGYRAIGEVDKAYEVARAVLAAKPAPAVRQALVPVLTAKLEQSTAAVAAVPAAGANAPEEKRIQEITTVAKELQAQAASVPLPAKSHIALADAYAKVGDTQAARASVTEARKSDPQVAISPSLQRALRETQVQPAPAVGGP